MSTTVNAKVFAIQARRFHMVANEKVLPRLNEVLHYLTLKPYVYILCRKGYNKRNCEHAHIYVAFARPVKLTSKNTLGCHIAKCRGTSIQNVNYIKDHHPIEVCEKGTLPDNDGDGVKEKWSDFVKTIHDDKVDKDSQLYARYEGYVKRRQAELKPKRYFNGNLKNKNIWIYGPPRTGKTYMALHAISDSVYDKSANKWWDGYQGEKVVVIEDLDPEQSKYLAHYLKKWADRNPFTAAIKGGSMRVCPADYNLIVTSNYSIEECFNSTDAKAIKERFETWYIPEKLPGLPEEE